MFKENRKITSSILQRKLVAKTMAKKNSLHNTYSFRYPLCLCINFVHYIRKRKPINTKQSQFSSVFHTLGYKL